MLVSKLSVYKDQALKKIQISQIRATWNPMLKVAKHVMWDQIAILIRHNWTQLSLVGDELELIKVAQDDINRLKDELENKLYLTNEIIKFLNGRNKEKLQDLNVKDGTSIIIDTKKVLTKRR
jgi:hypothetical protein